jgi:hypothetical protein
MMCSARLQCQDATLIHHRGAVVSGGAARAGGGGNSAWRFISIMTSEARSRPRLLEAVARERTVIASVMIPSQVALRAIVKSMLTLLDEARKTS